MRKSVLLLASSIMAITIVVVALIFLRVFRIPHFQVVILGVSNSPVHWIGWAGTLYIAFATPVYALVKRKIPRYTSRMLNVHVVGNLLAVLLVSIHFSHQVTRPAGNYPDLGTGIVLYAAMVLLVATGMLMISGVVKKFFRQTRFLHPAFALTFYMVIVMHIIHGL